MHLGPWRNSVGLKIVDDILKNGTYDCIHTFVDGGGIGIANVDTLEDAYDLLDDYPGQPMFDWEVRPLVDTGHAMKKSISSVEKVIG